MALPAPPQPPINEPPMADDGQHTQAWSQYHQKVSDALSGVRLGTKTNDNAKAGEIGEYIAGVSAGGGVVLTNGVVANVASIALTAGDYDVSGNVTFNPAPTTKPAALGASTSQTPATFGAQSMLIQSTFPTGQPESFPAGGVARYSLAAPATVYLVAVAFFTVAGMTAVGSLSARRAR